MRHFHPDELVDLADGTRSEAGEPHLLTCPVCRRQLADARAMISAVAAVTVPEPSPLFWDHLSARVHQAVVAEGAPHRVSWLQVQSWSRFVVPVSVGVFAALVLAVALTTRLGRVPRDSAAPPEIVAAGEVARSVEPVALADDPSLELVADLTEDMDWNTAREAGFAPRRGALDRAVSHLDDVERRELQRLLKEELARGNN
jgi:hypothetical protein